MVAKNFDIALDQTRADTVLARLVLAMLARHANQNKLAWPSQKTLARRAGVSDRSIRNALRKLEGLGEIRVVKPGQGRRSTTYRVEILCSNYEVNEPTNKRKHVSCSSDNESGTRGPVPMKSKPEPECRECGTRFPIEKTGSNSAQCSDVKDNWSLWNSA